MSSRRDGLPLRSADQFLSRTIDSCCCWLRAGETPRTSQQMARASDMDLGMMLGVEHRILLECVEIWIRIRIRPGTRLDKFNRLPCFGQQRRPGREKETRGARSGHASMVNCVRVHHRLAFVNASSQRRG